MIPATVLRVLFTGSTNLLESRINISVENGRVFFLESLCPKIKGVRRSIGIMWVDLFLFGIMDSNIIRTAQKLHAN